MSCRRELRSSMSLQRSVRANCQAGVAKQLRQSASLARRRLWGTSFGPEICRAGFAWGKSPAAIATTARRRPGRLTLTRSVRQSGLSDHEVPAAIVRAFSGRSTAFSRMWDIGARIYTSWLWEKLHDREPPPFTRAHLESLVGSEVRTITGRPNRSDDVAFDLAWRTASGLAFAEIKSLLPEHASQRLRLGLGQCLFYRHALRGLVKSTVTAFLVVPREPEDPAWPDACAEVDVRLIWPSRFGETLRDLRAS